MIEQIDIEKLLDLAYQAGDAIMEIYYEDFDVAKKDDHSPITVADKNSNDIIIKGLKNLFPDIPIISEESKQTPYDKRKDWKYCWLVDPLDGTKEFIEKNDEFTVNIALIENNVPVIGVVYAPALGNMYYAIKGEGSYKSENGDDYEQLDNDHEHYSEKDSIVVVASRSHLTEEVSQFVDDLQDDGKDVEFLSAGSSIKLCLVAEGEADVYPRFGPTMEWDTGAAHAIALEAGRSVLNAETREPLTYNKENLLNPWFIVE